MKQRKRAPLRPRTRGVAALEFALSLTFLVPLLMGMLDFGYYFYIGTTAEEAARAGARQLVNATAGPGNNCGTPNANAAITAAQAAAGGSSGAACTGGAASCYMNEPPLIMASAATITATCLDGTSVPPEAVNPTWRITVQVDFQPALGFFKNFMPVGSGGKVRYTARTTASN